MAYINKKKVKQKPHSSQAVESIKSGDWIKVFCDEYDEDPFYARLLGIANDEFAMYVYDQENGLAGWRSIPVNTTLSIRKLSLKEENMLPTTVRLCSYVGSEDWIDYRHTNFEIRLAKHEHIR